MSFPRQLTWLHLLPADTVFECRSGPAWLRDALANRAQSAGGRAVVAFGEQPHVLPPIKSAAAFVGVNCPAISNRPLQEAGFTRIARFAVLPNWDNPRWFIPLASPAVSSAGFNLYTPARTSARLKRFAARVAVYSRLPVWYRDQIVIAQREPSPIERKIATLFPRQPLAFALSAGAPEGARNRKASAAVIGPAGQMLAFLKLSGSTLADQLLRGEATVLRALNALPELEGLVPRLLDAGEIDGTFVTIQAPLPGSPAPTPIVPAHRAFLDALTPAARVPPARTQVVRDLPGRIAALPEPQPQLAAALDASLAALADQRIRAGAIHGDFAPWNLRRHRGRIAAFDWEYGRLEGPAGLDEIHYRLQVGYLLENWTTDRAVNELAKSEALDRYLSQPTEPARRALVALYLVDVLTRLFAEGYDATNDMVAWNLQLLSRVSTRTVAAPTEAVLA